jgi:SAM-dependent methyltransferase
MPMPFDQLAATYDRDFSFTPLGRALRQTVQTVMAAAFTPGDRVLELNCGTGEDAIWLAQRGLQVTATDASAAMRDVVKRKVWAAGLEARIEVRHLDLAQPAFSAEQVSFDGAFSNFGGLNCVSDLGPVCSLLAHVVRPGGRLLLVVMGRWCLWEIFWHLFHLKAKAAFRRWKRTGTTANLGPVTCSIWYHTTEKILKTLAPAFRCRDVRGIGVFLPPTYLQETFIGRPRLASRLLQLDRLLAGKTPFSRFGDHLLLDFERT